MKPATKGFLAGCAAGALGGGAIGYFVHPLYATDWVTASAWATAGGTLALAAVATIPILRVASDKRTRARNLRAFLDSTLCTMQQLIVDQWADHRMGPDIRERANALVAELQMISSEMLELDPVEIDLLSEVRRTFRIVAVNALPSASGHYFRFETAYHAIMDASNAIAERGNHVPSLKFHSQGIIDAGNQCMEPPTNENDEAAGRTMARMRKEMESAAES